MEDINKSESGYKINNIILTESAFFRINNVAFGEGVQTSLKIDTNVEVNEKVITVIEEATVIQTFNGNEQVNIKVKMVGIFECVGDTLLTDYEDFGRINGAAILFPYIREHVTNISLKGGLGAIMLPPVNFTKVLK